MRRIWLLLLNTFLLIFYYSNAVGLSLSDAVQYAINTTPDTRIKMAQMDASAQTIKQAQAGYFPTVDFTSGYGTEYAKNPVATSIDGTNESTLERTEIGIALKENIFDGFNTINEVKRTTNETLAAQYNVQGESNNLALNVTEQYLNVILQQKLLDIAKQNVVAHNDIAKMINERNSAGLTRDSEVTQSASRMALAESNVTSQRASLQEAQTRFQRYTNMQATNLEMPKIPNSPDIPKSSNEAMDVAYGSHPTLKSAKADVNAAIAQHDASKYTNYPKLDLVLESDRDDNVDGVKGENVNSLAMLQLSYNLFKGGADVAKQKQTAYQLVEANEIRNRTVLQIREAVNLAWTAMVFQKTRVQQLKNYNINAVKTLAAYKEEFKLNKRSLLDVLDSQNEVYRSNTEYKIAQYDEIFAKYRLLNAMGKLNQYLSVMELTKPADV